MNLECGVCLRRYNTRRRVPMVMECGHTICAECQKALPDKVCPIDRNPYHKLSINYQLRKLIAPEMQRSTLIDFSNLYKICVVGEAGVGKSSILNCLTGNMEEVSSATLGADLKYINQEHMGRYYKFQMWDTGGHQKFRSLTGLHYKNSHLVLVAYSLADQKSFREMAEYWLEEVQKRSPQSKILIIGNKLDLDRRVSQIELKELCAKYNCPEVKISCRQVINVQEVWQFIKQLVITDHSDVMSARLSNSYRLSASRESQHPTNCC